MKKGDAFITKDEKKIYFMVGRWGNDIVLASTDTDSDEVLIYGASELEGLISEGRFRKLFKYNKEAMDTTRKISPEDLWIIKRELIEEFEPIIIRALGERDVEKAQSLNEEYCRHDKYWSLLTDWEE